MSFDAMVLATSERLCRFLMALPFAYDISEDEGNDTIIYTDMLKYVTCYLSRDHTKRVDTKITIIIATELSTIVSQSLA